MKGPDASQAVLKLALATIFTALVCVATIVFVLPIPATKGYFNLGEIVIYVAALLFGPLVGGFAGGVGAGLADIINGYPQFAPGTFTIKLVEGLIVGYLGRRATSNGKKAIALSVIAIVAGGAEMIAGYFAYEVGVLSYPPIDALAEIPFNFVQMMVGLAFAAPLANIVRRVFPQFKS